MVELFRRYRLVAWLSTASLIFVLGGFIWALAMLSRASQALLILHFNDLSGITALGSVGKVMRVGILGLVVVGMNTAIAFEFEQRRSFLGKFLAGATLLFAALLFIAFAAIIKANI